MIMIRNFIFAKYVVVLRRASHGAGGDVKIYMVNRLCMIVACMLFLSPAIAASDITGFVHTINVNKSWAGIMVQLDTAPVFEAGSSCAQPWAYLSFNDDTTKYFLAVLSAAKAAGDTVRVATSGCVSTPLGLMPGVLWIDHGLRI